MVLAFSKIRANMNLIQGRYPPEYRREIVAPLMAAIQHGDSACVVGLSGVGKSNLTDFLERPEIKPYYLPAEDAERLHFALISCPASSSSAEIFAEMLASASLIAKRAHKDVVLDVPAGASPLQALRSFLDIFCGQNEQRLVYIFDEFESLIRYQPAEFFQSLRILRDDHRASRRLLFIVVTHRLPHLVPARSGFGRSKFFDVLSGNIYPLRPYLPSDAQGLLDTLLRARIDLSMTSTDRQRLIEASGGHAGLLRELTLALINQAPEGAPECRAPVTIVHVPSLPRLVKLASTNLSVRRVCENLWGYLHLEEQIALRSLVTQQTLSAEMTSFLQCRGLLLKNSRTTIFSPVFAGYVREKV
jgi:hypothetical protein